MTDKRRGLGRGLGALIPSGPVAPPVPPVTVPRSGEPGEERPGGSRAGSAPFGVDVLIPERTAPRPDPAAKSGEENPADDTAEPVTESPSGDDDTGTVADQERNGPTDIAPSEGDASAAGPVSAGELAAVPGASFAELPITSIFPNSRQPRTVFDEEAMAELVHSIREIGLLQPVVVRPVADGRYELVMGERRWRASTAAGLERIPAIVRSTDDTDMLRDALLENLHRSQLNPLEEAAAYDQLLQDFDCTHDELATRIGRSRPQVSNTLRLLRLPPLVQRRVAAGVLSAGHARALLGLDDAAAQERLAQRIVAEGLSVRAVEEIVALGGPEGSPAPERARRSGRPVAPRLQDLAETLSDRFETRVKVDLGRRKGRIVVEFASLDDLERIVGMMTPAPEASDPDAEATA